MSITYHISTYYGSISTITSSARQWGKIRDRLVNYSSKYENYQSISNENPPRVHKITLIAKEENLTLLQGNKISAFTWNGTVPAPTIKVTQEDLLNVTTLHYLIL